MNQDFQVTLSDLQCLIREEINDFDKGMKKCINFEMRESEMEGVNVLFHLMGYKKFVEYLFDDFRDASSDFAWPDSTDDILGHPGRR